MTLDDKVHLILDKLNGSEGSVLRTDIQAWLPEGHSNTVDNRLIINVLQTNDLVKSLAADIFIITAKGRRINDNGGWNKYRSRKRRDKIIKDVITYANIGFAALNIGILIYSLTEDNRIENEVDRLRIDLEKQHEIRDVNSTKLDSLEKVIFKQSKLITKMDSTIRVQGLTKKK